MLPNITAFAQGAGYIGIFIVIFAESGLFLGFFLPGDSFLFTAGILASQGVFNIALLMLVTFVAAVIGDSFGYYFGHKIGHRIFSKEDSFFFHKKHLIEAKEFYEAHGPKTIILARFVPIVRTFATILAGVGEMQYRKFLAYNIIGAVIWAIGMPLLGYALGSQIPQIDKYIIPVVLVIIGISFLPVITHLIKARKKDSGVLN